MYSVVLTSDGMYLAYLMVALLTQSGASFNTHICPEEVSSGIPFDIYGSPILPVALYSDHSNEILPPSWSTVSGIWTQNLLDALSTPDLSNCLFDDLPECESTFGEATERLLPPYEFPQVSDLLVKEVRGKKWGKSSLYDFKNTTLVVIRRTILIRCLYWCHAILHLPIELRPMMSDVCPNPCNQGNVCLGTGDVYRTCQLTGEGFFLHQYKCTCKENFVWDPAVQGCIPNNPCERQGESVCYSNGTLLCSYDPAFNEVSCLCNPKYMGDTCSIPANACEDLIRNPLLPNGGLTSAGNRACNVNNDGNRCLPGLDPDLGPIYSCTCSTGRWTRDISLGYDNCLKKVTKCDQIICIKGQCVDSRDGIEAACVCEEGYDSPMCATWTGVWSSWTPWSHCLPACGVERWAIRTRRCITAEHFTAYSENIDCREPSVELVPCDPHSCARKSSLINDKAQGMLQNGTGAAQSSGSTRLRVAHFTPILPLAYSSFQYFLCMIPDEGATLTRYFEIREHALQAVFVLAAATGALLALCWRLSLHAKLATRMKLTLRRSH
ncbi:unnamed protein product [Hydatigera taeniaeformis]|uniref:EGF-like domain-containing protein n=1 Tax=Hydatigena taeniaeformis TaxID=6205 RepID=A0A0R3WJ11_HYDTA|nr:unnamed protein product [Hydatigera taeniaeformis]